MSNLQHHTDKTIIIDVRVTEIPNQSGFGMSGRVAYDPCRNCPNNPVNNPHASGFCNCALPAMYNTIY